MKEFQKYYMVIAKCGHVGKSKYIPIKFAVVAENGKAAAKKVREFPRVKHNHKDAILDVKEITLEDFIYINNINTLDPYLQCRSKHEQKLIVNLNERLEIDMHSVKIKHDKQQRIDRVNRKLMKYKVIEKMNIEGAYDYAY